MAELTLRVGQLSKSINAGDARAGTVLDLYLRARYPLAPLGAQDADVPQGRDLDSLSNGERLEWIVADLVRWITENARGYQRMTLEQQAARDAEAARAGTVWE